MRKVVLPEVSFCYGLNDCDGWFDGIKINQSAVLGAVICFQHHRSA